MLSSRARSATRALGVLVVLVGLFGMHGLAQAQISGCHGADAVTQHSAMASAPLVDEMDEHAESASPQPVAASAMTAPSGEHGSLCQAVLPGQSGPVVGAFALALVVPVLGGAAPTMRTRARTRWKAPPISGVVLLHRVCVCRR